MALERGAEGERVPVADTQRDLLDTLSLAGEQHHCPLHTHPGDAFHRATSIVLLAEPSEVFTTHSGQLGQGLIGPGRSQSGIDVLPQLREAPVIGFLPDYAPHVGID